MIGNGVTGFNCPPEHAKLSEELTAAQKKMSELYLVLETALSDNQQLHERTLLVSPAVGLFY